MDSSREKRITLRFYMDDPVARETYDELTRRRMETGAVMNTLIVELLHQGLCQENALNLDELEKLFRSVIRSEGKALLREWNVSGKQLLRINLTDGLQLCALI